jgi:hypothetical protein
MGQLPKFNTENEDLNVLSKRFLANCAAFFEMFSTCKAGIMPYAHGVLHMTKEDSIFSPNTVINTAKNCPKIWPKKYIPFSLLICALINYFEGARKVVLQARIIFRLEKSGSANSDFFFWLETPQKRFEKVVLQNQIFFLLGDPEKNSKGE